MNTLVNVQLLVLNAQKVSYEQETQHKISSSQYVLTKIILILKKEKHFSSLLILVLKSLKTLKYRNFKNDQKKFEILKKASEIEKNLKILKFAIFFDVRIFQNFFKLAILKTLNILSIFLLG